MQVTQAPSFTRQDPGGRAAPEAVRYVEEADSPPAEHFSEKLEIRDFL
jgi:hypothetical protein